MSNSIFNNVLIFARHGESEWNATNTFTGRSDPGLTNTGRAQSRAIGHAMLSGLMAPTHVFTSTMLRARVSTRYILEGAHSLNIIPEESGALIERDYGILTGVNREVANKRYGKDQVQRWRRSLHEAPPGGESLAMTAERTRPFLFDRILPATRNGGVVLVVAHGNSIRSMLTQLQPNLDASVIAQESITPERPVFFTLDDEYSVINRFEINAYKYLDSRTTQGVN